MENGDALEPAVGVPSFASTTSEAHAITVGSSSSSSLGQDERIQPSQRVHHDPSAVLLSIV